jgi:acetyltransferase-like isoleucine patch superfamily enzyme
MRTAERRTEVDAVTEWAGSGHDASTPAFHDQSGWFVSVMRDRLRRLLGIDATNEHLIASGYLTVGRRTYGRPAVHYYRGDRARVKIGSFTSIASDVEILPGGNHHPEWVTTYPIRIEYGLPGALDDGQPASKGDVQIGNDVWIGRGAKILSGVTIGDGAVVAAYTVVVHDVEPYEMVGGVPARLIRRRFSTAQVEALLRIGWWNWTDDEIIENVSLLCSKRIDAFIERFDPVRPGPASRCPDRPQNS